MPAENPFPALRRLRFECLAIDPIRLPEYSGSAWRGLLGHGLRESACVTGMPSCANCLLLTHCAYPRLFETPAVVLRGREDDQAGATAPPTGPAAQDPDHLPHPFVLEPLPLVHLQQMREVAPDVPLALGLTLIGASDADLPLFIAALLRASQRGLGPRQARFRLTAVQYESSPGTDNWQRLWSAATGLLTPPPAVAWPPPRAPAAVAVTLCTLLRIKAGGQFIRPDGLTPADLLRNLHTRLGRLARLYGGDPGAFDWAALAGYAADVELTEPALRWQDWHRYSNRQQHRQPMGGLLGTFVLRGPALSRFWPALWFGQWAHLGKGTAFGLGAYRVAARA